MLLHSRRPIAPHHLTVANLATGTQVPKASSQDKGKRSFRSVLAMDGGILDPADGRDETPGLLCPTSRNGLSDSDISNLERARTHQSRVGRWALDCSLLRRAHFGL